MISIRILFLWPGPVIYLACCITKADVVPFCASTRFTGDRQPIQACIARDQSCRTQDNDLLAVGRYTIINFSPLHFVYLALSNVTLHPKISHLTRLRNIANDSSWVVL